jgi:peroxisome-assembly ATPase
MHRFPKFLFSARQGFSSFDFRAIYNSQIQNGKIRFDERQLKVVDLFEDLAKRLDRYRPPGASHGPLVASAPPAKSSWLGSFFKSSQETPIASGQAPDSSSQLTRGIYLYGSTGCGKTLLMDLFFEHVPIEAKKRVHFHGWLLDVHAKLHSLAKERKAAQKLDESDLIDDLANEMMKNTYFMCFDEFQVTFISDAVIMRRLFTKVFEKGLVMIATSNRPPSDLYLNGLNRELFVPFIPVLEKHCIVHDMDSKVDYRMVTASETDERSVYFDIRDSENVRKFEAKFYRWAQNQTQGDVELEIQGRKLRVQRAASKSKIAWFSFDELCNRPLGAADYIGIAKKFHTVFIDRIPQLTLQERDQMRRFITLIDAFYDNQVRLVITAAAEHPLKILKIDENDKKSSITAMDEVFAWDRTVSRLTEMQSAEYLAKHAKSLPAKEMLNQFSLGKLNESEIEDLWNRFDADKNGHIDESELEKMIEDLFEHTQGHRDVPDEVLGAALKSMDLNKDGKITKDDFFKYAKSYGLANFSETNRN